LRTSPLIVLAFLVGQVNAQAIDDAWVTERVLAGRYQELRVLEAQAERGSPVAMYWWAAMLQQCVFGRCDDVASSALFRKAAAAGHRLAKYAVVQTARSPEEVDRLLGKGGGNEWEGRILYAGALIGLSQPGPSSRDTWGEAKGVLKEVIATEPRLFAIHILSTVDGPTRYRDELRALVLAGHSPAMENYLRALLISERARFPEVLAKAKNGDVAAAVALCETVNVREGLERLPADLLAACEGVLTRGFAGVSATLLRHHRRGGDKKAAAFYADVCASLLVSCASELADYYYERSGKSETWKMWDALAGFHGRAPTDDDLKEFALSTELMQRLFTMRVRYGIGERACLARRYDAVTKKFEDDAACPRIRPVAIPKEFLGGKT